MSTLQPPLPSSLPSTPVCRIIWTILWFFFLVCFFFFREERRKERGEKLVHRHPDCPTHAVASSAFSFLPVAFQPGEELISISGAVLVLCASPRASEPTERPGRSEAPNYSIWKLWAARQRQTVARCVQDREPCFSTGSPGIISKGSWRKWKEGRKRSRAWRRGCSSTGESR